MQRGKKEEGVGCTKASVKANGRCKVRFKVWGMNADWSGEGGTRPVITQRVWQRGKVRVMKLRFSWQHTPGLKGQ